MPKSRSPRTRTSTTDAQPDAPVPSKVSIEVETATPSVPTYYVNNTGVETSVWDVKLRLSETIDTDKDRNILRIRELAIVRMSPQHAKVVLGILSGHLKKYEQQFGKIPGTSETGPSKEDED